MNHARPAGQDPISINGRTLPEAIRALPGVAKDPVTVPAILRLVEEFDKEQRRLLKHAPGPLQPDRREKGGHASTSATIADLPPLPGALLQQPLPMPEHVAGPGPLGIGGTLRFHCPLNCGWFHDENPGADAAVEPLRIVLPAGWTPKDISTAISDHAKARTEAFNTRVERALWDRYAAEHITDDPLPPSVWAPAVQEAVDDARDRWTRMYGYPPEQPPFQPVQWVTDDEAGRLLLSGRSPDEPIVRPEEPRRGDS